MHKMGKTPCCDKNGLKKGPWTAEEDQKLIDYIHEHGHGRWRTLPKYAGLQRCGKSCRLRWTNYLRPDIKRGKFSMEEEETIIQLHTILGNKWSAIAARLPGRTDNEIKNYWNTHIRKRLLRMGIDPLTHGPLLELSSPAVGPIYFEGPSSYEDHNNVPSSSNGIVLNEVLQQQPFSNLSNLSSSNSELIPQFFPQTLHHQQQNQMITFPNNHLQLPLSFQNLSSQDFQGRNATFSSSNASSSSSSSAHPFSICNGRSEVQQFSNPSNAVLNMDNDVSYSSCLTAQNVSFPPYHSPTPSYNHMVFESSAAANNMMVGSDFGFGSGGSSLSSNMSYFNSSSSDRAPSSFNGRTTPADAATDPYCNNMMVFDHYL